MTPFMRTTIDNETNRTTKERGSGTLEMAFVLSLVLFPLMFGIIDFSRALYAYHWVSYAAREGTRWASVHGTGCTAPMTECSATTAQIQTYVAGTIAPGMAYSGTGCTTNGCVVVTTTDLNPSSYYGGQAQDCTNGGAVSLGPPGPPGCIVQVNVAYYYGSTLPFIAGISGTTLKLQSTSQMVISQ
jgi:Flp pilus assembly protein TadG